jgi:hypothetical protein
MLEAADMRPEDGSRGAARSRQPPGYESPDGPG